MITCPNCHEKEMVGAIYCSNCGAQLVATNNVEDTFPAQEKKAKEPGHVQERIPLRGNSATGIALKLLPGGRMLGLPEQSEFTLGRSTSNQPVAPDVDLAAFDGFANGVSRLHAAIRIVEKQAFIKDLDSSNGTFVNGEQLPPEVEQPLHAGDLLALGTLKMQVVVK